jgi:alpha-L-fucosidase
MPAKYSKTSPWYNTNVWGRYLDVMTDRPVKKLSSDVLYTIDKIYEKRPDLLAFDLYGDSALWWVFAQRNPDVLKDPLNDFNAGISIRIPTKDRLVQDLGL